MPAARSSPRRLPPALTNALPNEGWHIPSDLLGFWAMKKKHIYNALICMGLFMLKPEVA